MKKSFFIDLLNTNNKLYRDSLTLSESILKNSNSEILPIYLVNMKHVASPVS